MTTPDFAPWLLEPDGPILARRFAFAMGDSVAMNEVTALDWAQADVAARKTDTIDKLRIVHEEEHRMIVGGGAVDSIL